MRTITDLQQFAATAGEYQRLRLTHPTVPASTVLGFIRDPDICQNLDQYICRHEWSDPEGYRVYCVYCGLDGDG